MDIFEKLEEISKNGYSIEYVSVDQYQNGYGKDVEKGLMPAVTYTLQIIRLSDDEIIYSESLNHIKDCLEKGIEYIETVLKLK